MKGFRPYRLGDGCSIKHGYAFKGANMTTEQSDLPVVVNIVNFRYEGGFRFGSTKIQRHVPGAVDGYVLEPGDVLLVMTCQTPGGEILGVPGKIPDDGVTYLHNQRLGKMEIFKPEDLDAGFLYNLFLSRPFNQHLVATATGAKILHTAPKRIEDFRFPLPPLPTQRRIASILSAYDDLIENNTKRIEILEEMARSLYREWFVHFRFPGHEKVKLVDSELGKIPEGWEVVNFGTLVDEIRDSVKPGELPNETPYFGLEHLPRRSIALYDWGAFGDVASTKLRARENDILFGKIRPYFHKVSVCPLEAVCSSDTIVLRAKKPEHLGLAISIASSDEFVAHATTTSKGTKMPRADWKILTKYPVALAPAKLQRSFSSFVGDLVRQIRVLGMKNQVLRQTRDLLLPKLISGEIDVDALDLQEELPRSGARRRKVRGKIDRDALDLQETG